MMLASERCRRRRKTLLGVSLIFTVSSDVSWSFLMRPTPFVHRCAPWSSTTTTTHQHHHHRLTRTPQLHRHKYGISTPMKPRQEFPMMILTAILPSGDNPGNNNRLIRPLLRAATKFKARPGTYLLIPCVAAVVGWVTNWLAVQMIFYPIEFRGIPLYRKPEVPLGFLGWQGIIPCKTRPMTESMVDMVTTQLLTVRQAFARLDPERVARILAPEVPVLAESCVRDVAPSRLAGASGGVIRALSGVAGGLLRHGNVKFLERLCVKLQENADSVFSLHNCVVSQMMQNRAKLGELFRKCGQAELDFLTNSGLWFGFLLGIVQMVVALFYENPWSLSIGGGIVGFATNWLALKWIFQPVDPVQVGPLLLQGKFLRRQKEVAAEFSDYFANNILTSHEIWKSILTDPETKPAFTNVFSENFQHFVGRVVRGLRLPIKAKTLDAITYKAVEKLPDHVHVLYPYMDETLGLEDTLRVKMEQMSSRKFERVLHPIFEEDELTLILAGAALGFAAGLLQQALETGRIVVPDWWTPTRRYAVAFIQSPIQQTRVLCSEAIGITMTAIASVRKKVGRTIPSFYPTRVVPSIETKYPFVTLEEEEDERMTDNDEQILFGDATDSITGQKEETDSGDEGDDKKDDK